MNRLPILAALLLVPAAALAADRTAARTAPGAVLLADEATSAACPQAGDCASCTRCALIGPCATLYGLCQLNASCVAVDQCFYGCGTDASCKQQCYQSYSAGALAYQAVLQCVDCEQCPTACAGLCT